MLKTELNDAYLDKVHHYLNEFKSYSGILIGAKLGKGNKGSNYMLRESKNDKQNW
jgi:hypothetical protein